MDENSEIKTGDLLEKNNAPGSKSEKESLKEKIEVTKPFELRKFRIIEDFFYANRSYVEQLQDQILNQNKYFPYICLNLKDIMQFNEELYRYIIKSPEEAIRDLNEILLKNVKYVGEIDQFLKDKENCKFEQVHLSFNIDHIRENILLYDDFLSGTKPYVGKFTRIVCRFLDLQLYRENVATVITFECLVCGTEFDILQFKVRKGRYTFPNFCISRRCKAKGKYDFRIKKLREYRETGSFRIADKDFSKQVEKECFTFLDFNYFSQKAQKINLNDIIEIIGIIKLEYSEIGTRKEDQKIPEYVEVIDFKPIELKTMDNDIIKDLYDQFQKNKNYHYELLDAIHPITKGIYSFRLLKQIYLLSIESGDSWDTVTKDRCSINAICGSAPSLFKTTIRDDFRKILGVNNIGTISGQDNTPKAFIPTSQRGKESDFVIRYGAFAYNNRKTLFIDESQYMLKNPDLNKPIKYLEQGFIDRGSDGTVLYAECKLSICFLLNYIRNKELGEGYDYTMTLQENLFNISESILQRIDLHYTIPKLPVQIMDVIEKRMFYKDESVIDSNRIYNYINEAKRIYPLQKLSPQMEDKLIEFIKMLRTERGQDMQNVRELKTLIKLVCGISAMRLKLMPDESDLEYLRDHFVDLMIPFFGFKRVRDLRLVGLNLSEVFRETLDLLTEINNSIPIHMHIAVMRQYLQNHYFPEDYETNEIDSEIDTNEYKLLDKFKFLDKYMPGKLNLENSKYRTLYEDPQNRDHIKKLGFIIAKHERSIIYVKKAWLQDIFLKEIDKMYDSNDESMDIEMLIEELQLDYHYDEDTIRLILADLPGFKIENNFLSKK